MIVKREKVSTARLVDQSIQNPALQGKIPRT